MITYKNLTVTRVTFNDFKEITSVEFGEGVPAGLVMEFLTRYGFIHNGYETRHKELALDDEPNVTLGKGIKEVVITPEGLKWSDTTSGQKNDTSTL